MTYSTENLPVNSQTVQSSVANTTAIGKVVEKSIATEATTQAYKMAAYVPKVVKANGFKAKNV